MSQRRAPLTLPCPLAFLQAREADLKAQLRAKEEEALRAAQAAAAAPPPRVAAAAYDEPAPMEDAGGDEFEDAENLPNISKMTIPQVGGSLCFVVWVERSGVRRGEGGKVACLCRQGSGAVFWSAAAAAAPVPHAPGCFPANHTSLLLCATAQQMQGWPIGPGNARRPALPGAASWPHIETTLTHDAAWHCIALPCR